MELFYLVLMRWIGKQSKETSNIIPDLLLGVIDFFHKLRDKDLFFLLQDIK